MPASQQTIFALSSGRPPSAIAVVRVSGPQAAAVVAAIAGQLPLPRKATRAVLLDPRQQPIDDALVLWFPAPASATGEDVVEFHVHGGRAVLAALFAALSAFENVRAAEPGEFTRRAFENGKLDLTEAEGLDDLVHADTERQRRQALRQLKGLLGGRARDWRTQIIEASALIEAGIDFSDEADVPAELIAPALERIKRLLGEIDEVLGAQGRSERLRDGLVVAIAGPPNVGKSTLMNQLARREVAIVSPHAGTTRDIIEVQLDLDGYPVTVIDTAGIRDTDDPVEQEGVRRARTRAAEADLVLWLVDGRDQQDQPPTVGSAGMAGDRIDLSGGAVWRVRNKIDLAAAWIDRSVTAGAGLDDVQLRPQGREFGISASRGDGLPELIAAVVSYAQHFFGGDESALIARQRQRQLLQQTAEALRRSIAAIGQGEELAAEDLRIASYALGRLLGRVDVEDILDAIFRDFCIGK
jgi:tRNA modification GTPase